MGGTTERLLGYVLLMTFVAEEFRLTNSKLIAVSGGLMNSRIKTPISQLDKNVFRWTSSAAISLERAFANHTMDFENFFGSKFRTYRDQICSTQGPTVDRVIQVDCR